MVRRYFQVKEYLVNFDDTPLIVNILNAKENDDLQKLNVHLETFNSIKKALQGPIDCLTVRILFDEIISLYLCMSQYISIESNIVYSKDFESGIVKIMSGYEDNLSDVEVGATLQLLKISINNSYRLYQFRFRCINNPKKKNTFCPSTRIVDLLY
ncbi:hypothetical protein A3Q56_05098 [Intoshia linei]|uniref:Uncharacterized protein n=1 Tax=Intoshia linei TaxID=1819745 RepID=A0A177AYR3_9BILA|nr:hypothetical protein A3Q56_05098 [Intoshia linei]